MSITQTSLLIIKAYQDVEHLTGFQFTGFDLQSTSVQLVEGKQLITKEYNVAIGGIGTVQSFISYLEKDGVIVGLDSIILIVKDDKPLVFNFKHGLFHQDFNLHQSILFARTVAVTEIAMSDPVWINRLDLDTFRIHYPYVDGQTTEKRRFCVEFRTFGDLPNVKVVVVVLEDHFEGESIIFE